MKDNMISHITYFFDFVILPQGIPGARFADKITSGDSPGPPGAKLQNRKISYVRNHVIFHLKPVPSKNIEK